MNIERLQSDFLRVISTTIQREIKDPQVGFVTVTEVQITKDLSFATIYFSTLDKNGRQDNALEALNRAKGFIKKELSRAVKIRKIPDLIFKYDEALDYGNKIDRILHKIK